MRTENEINGRSKRSNKRIVPDIKEEQDLPPQIPMRSDSQLLRNKRNLESKSQVSVQTNNSDILLNNPKYTDNNKHSIITADNAKPYHPHVPIKVHVANKPTLEDTTRVYNPYPLQNEYEKYFKNGFLFEPVNNNNNQPISSSRVQSHSINANVNFSSDLISPYTRQANSIYLKNPVQNDKLLDYARQSKTTFGGAVNHSYLKDDSEIESEFQNLNQLKQKNETRTEVKNEHDKYFDDELDLINKYRKKSENKLNDNAELINSITQELKRLKTGYKPASSNA